MAVNPSVILAFHPARRARGRPRAKFNGISSGGKFTRTAGQDKTIRAIFGGRGSSPHAAWVNRLRQRRHACKFTVAPKREFGRDQHARRSIDQKIEVKSTLALRDIHRAAQRPKLFRPMLEIQFTKKAPIIREFVIALLVPIRGGQRQMIGHVYLRGRHESPAV